MALGSGWTLDETEDYGARYDELVRGDSWLEDQIEILYIGLLRGPTGPAFASKILGEYWYAILPGPPQLVLFYSVDEEAQIIMLETLRVSQPDDY